MELRSYATDLFLELAEVPSPHGHEAAVATFITRLLENWGLGVVQDGAGVPLGGDSGNLIARVPGTGRGRAVMLCAHLDTVPHSGRIVPDVVDGVVRSRGDTILGADNKASVAAIIEATRRLVHDHLPHPPLELVFTIMEEAGCRGAALLDTAALEAKAGFIFDHAGPLGSYVTDSPAGYLVTVTYTGRAAHAGVNPELGRSAIAAAAQAISRGPSGRVRTAGTSNVGVIHGGVAHNIVAEKCSFTVDIRSRSQAEAESMVEELQTRCVEAGDDLGCKHTIDIQEKYRAYSLTPGEGVVSRAEAALRACGFTPTGGYAGSGSDACIFNARGLPTVNLGSGMRNIHTADEAISVEDIENMVDVTLALVAEADR
jgi:tripeptide aminopeptidase